MSPKSLFSLEQSPYVTTAEKAAMKKSQHAIVSTVLLLTCMYTLHAESFGRPGGHEDLFLNRFYAKYAHGISIYLKDPRNGYTGLSSEDPIKIGMTLEPEAGIIVNDRIQVGASYLYMDGKSEFDGLFGIFYDDVFLSGASVKVKYFLINKKNFKVPVGAEAIFGQFKMFTGRTDSSVKNRPLSNNYEELFAAYRCFEANGYGGGITGSFVYQPRRFLSFGFDAALRILKSEPLKARPGTYLTWGDLLLRPLMEDVYTDHDENLTLDFSSMNFCAFVALQY